MMTRFFALASLFAWLFAAPTLAQTSGKTVPGWDGRYVGVSLGQSRSQANYTWETRTFGPDSNGVNIDLTGTSIGLSLGQNYRSDGMLYGFETDLRTIIGVGAGSPCIADDAACDTQIEALASFSGRLGVITETDLLLYMTAGVSAGKVAALSETEICGDTACALSATRVGWNAGAGIEKALSDGWRIKADYTYINLNSERESTNPAYTSLTSETAYGVLSIGLASRF